MKIFFAVLFLTAVLCETPGLRIYYFDIGEAESQLLVFPSGYTILIDVGEKVYLTSGNAEYVAKRIREILGKSYVDVLVISHLHLDHMGDPGSGGVWNLLEKQNITVGKLVERDAANWVDANGDGKCKKKELVWKYVGECANYAEDWLCYSLDPNSKAGKIREVAQLCSTSQIHPPDADTEVLIYTTDGIGAVREDGVSPIAANYYGQSRPPAENDYSIGLRIQWKNFVYVTSGDLSGQFIPNAVGFKYDDVESQKVDKVGEVDLYKVNHHGDSRCSNENWIDVTKPSASVVMCGDLNPYGFPTVETLERLKKYGKVFLTERGANNRNYNDCFISSSDLIVTVYDTYFTITSANNAFSPETYTIKTSKVPPVKC